MALTRGGQHIELLAGGLLMEKKYGPQPEKMSTFFCLIDGQT
jgi:hypothetical protein